jgi:hypothetical protein
MLATIGWEGYGNIRSEWKGRTKELEQVQNGDGIIKIDAGNDARIRLIPQGDSEFRQKFLNHTILIQNLQIVLYAPASRYSLPYTHSSIVKYTISDSI